MSLGDEELNRLNSIIREFGVCKNVVSDVGTRAASVKILKWK